MTRRGFLAGLILMLIPGYVLYQESRAASYGNGIFCHYLEIINGIYITNTNGAMLTHGKQFDYAAIIWPDQNLISSDGDTILVEKLTRYAIDHESLIFEINPLSPLMFKFPARLSIGQSKPIQVYDVPDVGWVDLINRPFMVYFWHPVVVILLLIELFIFTWLIIWAVRNYRLTS